MNKWILSFTFFSLSLFLSLSLLAEAATDQPTQYVLDKDLQRTCAQQLCPNTETWKAKEEKLLERAKNFTHPLIEQVVSDFAALQEAEYARQLSEIKDLALTDRQHFWKLSPEEKFAIFLDSLLDKMQRNNHLTRFYQKDGIAHIEYETEDEWIGSSWQDVNRIGKKLAKNTRLMQLVFQVDYTTKTLSEGDQSYLCRQLYSSMERCQKEELLQLNASYKLLSSFPASVQHYFQQQSFFAAMEKIHNDRPYSFSDFLQMMNGQRKIRIYHLALQQLLPEDLEFSHDVDKLTMDLSNLEQDVEGKNSRQLATRNKLQELLTRFYLAYPDDNEVLLWQRSFQEAKEKLQNQLTKSLPASLSQVLNAELDRVTVHIPEEKHAFFQHWQKQIKDRVGLSQDPFSWNDEHQVWRFHQCLHWNSDTFADRIIDELIHTWETYQAISYTGAQHIRLSWQAFQSGQQGQKVIAHEMGHVVFHRLNHFHFVDDEHKQRVTDIFTCLNKMHPQEPAPPHPVSALPVGLYSSEDFADLLAFTSFAAESDPTMCIDVDREHPGALHTDSDKNKDPHSTVLLRILHEISAQARFLPESCQELLDRQAPDFELASSCLPSRDRGTNFPLQADKENCEL